MKLRSRHARALGVFVAVGLAAAAADAADFESWIEALRAEALRENISAGTVDAALAGVRPSDRVIQLDRNQPEFTQTFSQYLDRAVTSNRVREGRRKLAEHRALLEEIRARYDVQPRFVVALWGIESDFGRRTGSFPVIQALATLAYDGRRKAFFRGELLDALRIIDEGHVETAEMLGSWAGAVGQPQFMPSSFRNFAVDHDGDSRRDLWRSVPDTLASIANYLARHGWRGDLIWGREVRLPEGFDPGLAGRDATRKLEAWQRLGVRRPRGRALPRADVTAWIVQPGGPDGPAFLVYGNYDVLLKWNRSDYFATSVGILADRLVGR